MSRKKIDRAARIFESEISDGVMIREFCSIRNSFLGFMCQIYEGVIIKKSKVGERCEINAGTYIENPTIGNNVQIGPNCSIVGVTHDFSAKGISHEDIFERVSVGDETWIGASVVILPGFKIGKNVVIGAGSIVGRDIPDNHRYVGSPLGNKLQPIE